MKKLLRLLLKDFKGRRVNGILTNSDARCNFYLFPFIKLFLLTGAFAPKIIVFICFAVVIDFCFLSFAVLPDKYWDDWMFCWHIIEFIFNFLWDCYAHTNEEEAFRTAELAIVRQPPPVDRSIIAFINSCFFQVSRALTGFFFNLSIILFDCFLILSLFFFLLGSIIFFFIIVPVFEEIPKIPVKPKKGLYYNSDFKWKQGTGFWDYVGFFLTMILPFFFALYAYFFEEKLIADTDYIFDSIVSFIFKLF